jgi:hypothetical protein
MITQFQKGSSFARPPRLLRCDLCAQLAPINRYGPTGLSVALVDGLRALVGSARRARAGEADEVCRAHC